MKMYFMLKIHKNCLNLAFEVLGLQREFFPSPPPNLTLPLTGPEGKFFVPSNQKFNVEKKTCWHVFYFLWLLLSTIVLCAQHLGLAKLKMSTIFKAMYLYDKNNVVGEIKFNYLFTYFWLLNSCWWSCQNIVWKWNIHTVKAAFFSFS